MSPHSPKPWVVNDCRVYPAGGQAEGPLCVCAQFGCPKTELANARLIAAAPDLLEALEAAFENDHESVFSQNFWDRARAAISKAYNG